MKRLYIIYEESNTQSDVHDLNFSGDDADIVEKALLSEPNSTFCTFTVSTGTYHLNTSNYLYWFTRVTDS